MNNRVFVNGTIATKSWRETVRKILLFPFFILVMLSVVPAVLIWFVSLGHINLVGVWAKYFDSIGTRIYGEG